MPASVQNYEATVTMFQKYTFLSRRQTFGLKNCFNNKISVSSHSACKHSHIKKLFKTICCCNRHHSSDYSLFNFNTVHDHHPSHQSHIHVFSYLARMMIWQLWWLILVLFKTPVFLISNAATLNSFKTCAIPTVPLHWSVSIYFFIFVCWRRDG